MSTSLHISAVSSTAFIFSFSNLIPRNGPFKASERSKFTESSTLRIQKLNSPVNDWKLSLVKNPWKTWHSSDFLTYLVTYSIFCPYFIAVISNRFISLSYDSHTLIVAEVISIKLLLWATSRSHSVKLKALKKIESYNSFKKFRYGIYIQEKLHLDLTITLTVSMHVRRIILNVHVGHHY